jgi:hypothetical protein
MAGVDPASAAAALEVKKRVEAELMTVPGVDGVGFGAKTTGGQPTGELVIRVHVRHKRPLDEVPTAERIPSEIGGVKTDVVQYSQVARVASIEGGDEIEVKPGGLTSVGTLGCIAQTNAAPQKLVILSNDHVLAAGPGTAVIVSSCSDCCETTIAHILGGGQDNATIDAAIAEVVAGQETHARIHGVPVTGTLDLQNPAALSQADITALGNLTYRVHKYGATTSLTHGIVTDVHFPATSTELSPAKTDQIEVKTGPPQATKRFSKHGDSGSVIYNDAGQVIALLWGATPDDGNPPYNTVGSPIMAVQTQLGITISTNPPAVMYRPGLLGGVEATRVYADLGRGGAAAPLVALYELHRPEVRGLLRSNRRFVIAWHRNHGPLLARALLDVAEHRLREVPAMLADRTWADCVARIARVLLAEGSAALRADVARWEQVVADLGGRSYEHAIRMVARVAAAQARA